MSILRVLIDWEYKFCRRESDHRLFSLLTWIFFLFFTFIPFLRSFYVVYFWANFSLFRIIFSRHKFCTLFRYFYRCNHRRRHRHREEASSADKRQKPFQWVVPGAKRPRDKIAKQNLRFKTMEFQVDVSTKMVYKFDVQHFKRFLWNC